MYEVADGLSRNADLRQKNQLLSNRLIELEQLINRLRFQDDHHASSTLARLRLGDDIRAIIQDDSENMDGTASISFEGPNSKRLRTGVDSMDRQSVALLQRYASLEPWLTPVDQSQGFQMEHQPFPAPPVLPH